MKSYKDVRRSDFKKLVRAVGSKAVYSSSRSLVACGDSLQVLRSLPDSSVSLILTDPPYHVTKKKNIKGDTDFSNDQEYLSWMREYAVEWKRVLKPNGALYCFCDSSMASRLDAMFQEKYNVLSHVVWTKPNLPGYDGWKGKMKKEALRQWYPHSERILFCEPACEGNLFRSFFGRQLRLLREETGLSGHQLTAKSGAYGKVNHGGAVSNWEAGRNTPSREQYGKICAAFIETGRVNSVPPYEDLIRPFHTDKSKEFTDVWNFPSVKIYRGKHPAEKPVDLLLHAIESSTWDEDIVLDCFSGTGSTGMAALALNRRILLIDVERRWCDVSASRLKECERSKNSMISRIRSLQGNEDSAQSEFCL